MERGEIGKFPTGVDILAAHRCNQVTPKHVMRVDNVIMVGGSRFFCLAPCLYVWNSFYLVVVTINVLSETRQIPVFYTRTLFQTTDGKGDSVRMTEDE